jgi:thiosulfate dehydrogenase (quinone) large subunit
MDGVTSDPIIWLVIMRIACGLWFLASGLRKATREGMSHLIPEEMRRYTKTAPAFYRTFLDAVAIPHARLFAVLVVAGEIGVGVGLAAGLFTPVCAAVGIFLNLNYLLATGAGNHAEQAQNGAMILMQLAVIATGAGRVVGLDGLLFAP